MTVRRALFIALSVVSPLMLHAQSGLSGYVLTLPVYQRYADDQLILPTLPKSQFTELTRIRLRGPIPFGETTYLQVEAEGAFEYASEGQHGLMDTRYRSRQLVDLTTKTLDAKNIYGVATIDRLFLRFDLFGVDVIAGRQRISWGVGRVWSPTDLFNPLNPAILGKIEKDGADAVVAKITFGSFTDATVVVNGQKELRFSSPPLGPEETFVMNAGVRIRTLVQNTALSFMGGIFDERGIIGGDVTMDILDAGVRFEGLYSFERTGSRPQEAYINAVIGIDNQFTSRLYVMGEYFYNGRGETDRIRYRLVDLLNGEVTNLGKHIFAVQGSYLVHPLATLSLMVFRNLNDESTAISPQILYFMTDDISLSAGGQYFTGGRFSEFWWYPSTGFLRGDFYF